MPCRLHRLQLSGLGNNLSAPMLKSRRLRNSTASNFPVVKASRKGISMIYRDVLYSYADCNDRVTLTCARESWPLCQLNLPQRKTKIEKKIENQSYIKYRFYRDD